LTESESSEIGKNGNGNQLSGLLRHSCSVRDIKFLFVLATTNSINCIKHFSRLLQWLKISTDAHTNKYLASNFYHTVTSTVMQKLTLAIAVLAW